MGRDPGRRSGPGDAETRRNRERTGRPRHPGGPRGVRGNRPRLSLKPRHPGGELEAGPGPSTPPPPPGAGNPASRPDPCGRSASS